ncbi:MAG: hypothetical protein ABIT70_05075, partial [Sulfuriferula sp.]
MNPTTPHSSDAWRTRPTRVGSACCRRQRRLHRKQWRRATRGKTSNAYDPNGNVISDGVRSYTNMSFNLPQTITQGATALTFLYGTEHQRI